MLFNNFGRKPGKRIIILHRGADKYVAQERFWDWTRRKFPYLRCFIFLIDLIDSTAFHHNFKENKNENRLQFHTDQFIILCIGHNIPYYIDLLNYITFELAMT